MALPTDAASTKTGRPIAARYEFLDCLIESLTACEWRYLRERLMRRCFHYDVFGKLPLELAVFVAGYLDPLDVVALRRVSKRWHSLLTNDELTKQVFLNCWPQQKLPDPASWVEHLDQRLYCEHALAFGRPWSKADYMDSSLNLKWGNVSEGQLHGSHFAWRAIDSGSNLREHIAVLSLGTGKLSRYFPSTRSCIRADTVGLSDLLVGCISSDGHCEVFDIETGTCHSFRLPSNRYQKFIVQSDKVACISMDIHSLRPRVSLNIMTWDLTSKTHRHASLDAPLELSSRLARHTDRLKWILGYDSMHMIDPGASTEIRVSEFGISIYQAPDADMSLMVGKVSEIDIRRSRVIASRQIQIADTQPTRLREGDPGSGPGHDFIIIPEQEIGANRRYRFKIASVDCWVYSLKSNSAMNGQPYRRDRSPFSTPRPFSPATHRVMTYTTRGIGLKFVTWERDQQSLREVVPEIPEKEALVQLKHQNFPRENHDPARELPRVLFRHPSLPPWFGNNRFFVIAESAKIRVYCFDRKFVLPNEDLSYRREREEKADARKAKRLHGLRSTEKLQGCSGMTCC